jgi:hypothetical protein
MRGAGVNSTEESAAMDIDLSKLNYPFRSKPLLIGGMAMQYYGLRPSGADIDFVVTREDYTALARRYPQNVKDLWGDLGVCPFEFELWTSICLFDYAELIPGAIDAGEYRVIALDKLLFLKALAMKEEKCHHDLELIVEKIRHDKHAPWWDGLSEERRASYLIGK